MNSKAIQLYPDQSSQFWRKSFLNIHWRDWYWSWNSNTLAPWCKELTHWKRCWESLKAGGKGDDRGWDGQMASPTRWTWVWASFGSWWWTGKPGMLQSMGLQRAGHDWASELNWQLIPFRTIFSIRQKLFAIYQSSLSSHLTSWSLII